MDGIAAALFILANIGIGFLPCTAWVRYGVSAFAIMGYAGICYKKQIGKAVFVMLAFYNLHCLSFLIANSIYMKIMSVMMKRIDFLQNSYQQEVDCCMAVGMFCLIFAYSVLFVAMALILYRFMKDVSHNGLAGCYPAFHSEFCREHDYKNHQRADYCKDRG